MSFEKVLIANRGEIALRVHRACHDLGLRTVAVHSTADAKAKHVRLADESVCIGPPNAQQSYLNMVSILSAATISGAGAIHPGYGFLSENAEFAQMVAEHGMTFIGPSADLIRKMGDKISAKETVKALGIPTVPGSDGPVNSPEAAQHAAASIGYPVIIKATSGGGGRGMQIALNPSELIEKWSLARQEAKSNFGNDVVYMEKFLSGPRHIEIQVIGDAHGNAIHLGERDCSLQRRHQKVWEEAGSPVLSAAARDSLGELCRHATAQMGYVGAGTFEFLYEDGAFYFIEMNTRVQVEHPVTEQITGVDIVREQILVAQGHPLSIAQKDVQFRGHAIEVRINAEHPQTFMPSPGRILKYHVPGGIGVRVDSAVYGNYVVPPYYDSMIAKLIVHGQTREECLRRLARAMEEYVITGIETTLPLHQRLVSHPQIQAGEYDIHWLEKFLKEPNSL